MLLILFCFSWTLTLGLCFCLFGFYAFEKLLSFSSPLAPVTFEKLFKSSGANSSESMIKNEHVSNKNCAICGSSDCLRRIDRTSASYKALKIPKVIDDALEDFLNAAFQSHLHIWYDVLTNDKAFVVDLRFHLRRALASLLHRALEVDLNDLILKKILPPSLSFLNEYLQVRNEHATVAGFDDSGKLEQLVLDRIKPNLHSAMYSRETEMVYLQSLSEFALSQCIDPSANFSPPLLTFLRELLTFGILSPAMDIVADPDIINRLLELFFDLDAMESFEHEKPSPKVALLENFVHKNDNGMRDSFLNVKLCEVLDNQRLFFAFMNFMKNVGGPINWLQFLLSARELQQKMSSPDSSLENYVRWEIWELYRNFFHETAPDRIDDFNEELSAEFKSAMETSEDMQLLRQTLENTYKDIYEKLQKNFITSFLYSAEFMDYVCSDQDGAEIGFEAQEEIEENEKADLVVPDADARSLQGSVMSSLVECDVDDAEAFLHVDELHQDEEDFSDPFLLNSPKDLNLWKVTMPKVEPRRDPNTGRTMYIYVVVVERQDLPDSGLTKEWKLDRRYHEFFVLETKLVEFHGESIVGGFPLPPKKTFNTKSRAFVESMRSIFEQFLKRLLASHHLKSSELLFAFLTSRQEFTLSFLSNPLRAVKSIPAKLVFERGQNLLQFLQNFVDSIDWKPQQVNSLANSKSNASLSSLLNVDRSNSKEPSKVLESVLFKNNSNIPGKPPPFTSEYFAVAKTSSRGPGGLSSIYDALLFLMHNVFHISRPFFALLLSARVLIKESFEKYVDAYLRHKLHLALHEQRVAQLIRLLLETLFIEEAIVRSDLEKKERARRALQSIFLYFDVEFGFLKKLVGEKEFETGVGLIFECLQNPRLNKQLSYTLLDIVVCELFHDSIVA